MESTLMAYEGKLSREQLALVPAPKSTGTHHDADHTRSPLAILYSDNLEASEQKVRSAGGKIVKLIFSFPGGRRFHFTDPSGNELAIWSDK